jgi:hypothetical protein
VEKICKDLPKSWESSDDNCDDLGWNAEHALGETSDKSDKTLDKSDGVSDSSDKIEPGDQIFMTTASGIHPSKLHHLTAPF